MEERSVYGQQFTDEVKDQLQEWGVVAVKNIELMDIRDSKDSNVIENIMDKKEPEKAEE
jgi:flotillin